MTHYLMIESRDPYETAEGALSYDLAARMARAGHAVTLFLVQNAVLAARRGARGSALAQLAGNGVEVLADEFSLRERGIGRERMNAHVKAAPLEVVVDRLAAGCKALWH
jgi:sulfur relay (sulfurtransferase) complex TusBCD TusD component (DsrE family)